MARVEGPPILHVLPSGRIPGNPSELLKCDRWRSLCVQLREQFSFVLVDTPPVGVVADYDLIAAQVDGVVLVVRPDHTLRPLCNRALAAIPPEKLLGIVMNCMPEWFLWRHAGYGYSYTYRNAPGV